MSSTILPYTKLSEPANNDTLWDVPLNNNFVIIDGYLSYLVPVTITTSDVTLSVPVYNPNSGSLGQLQSFAIALTGALTGNRSLIIPNGYVGRWIIANNTSNSASTGPWTITVKTDITGATVIVPQGYSVTVFCDGTNVYLTDNGLLNGGFPASFAITPRIVEGTKNSATQSPNGNTTDIYEINGLSVAITTFNAPSGTPVDGQKLIIRIVDDGTARAISGWDAKYQTIGTTLPTTTIAGKYLYLGCIYNSNANSGAGKWDVIATAQQA